LLLAGSLAYSVTLKMEAVLSSKLHGITFQKIVVFEVNNSNVAEIA
jgi:hypothetical protein